MGISGTQKALMYAQAGVMRAGASRACYTSPKVFVSIAGVQYAAARAVDANRVLDETLSVNDVLNQTPNTAAATMQGAEPAEGSDVVITLGSINNLDRLYAGTVLNRTHVIVSPTSWTAPLNVIDYTWQLTRRRVSGSFANVSPAVVAAAIVAAVPGFTLSVAAGLPAIDAISFTDVDALSALTQLATRIGGYCDVDYHKVVKLFITDSTVTNPVALTSTHVSLTEFAFTRDLSQVRTRVFVQGGGVMASGACAVGSTSLPVTDVSWYEGGGGTVVSGPQRVTYTGKTAGVASPVLALGQWTARTPVAAVRWFGVTWAPALGIFAAVAFTGTTAQQVMTSPDGVTWTAHTSSSAQSWIAIAWSPSLSLFAAVSFGGGTLIMTSPDGITWTSRTAPVGVTTFSDVTWSPTLSLFVAVGITAPSVSTSPDGITWTSRTASNVNQWWGVTWATALSLFVAVARDTSTTNSVMTSPDGITWTARTAASNKSWNRVTWSPALALLVAVAGSGASGAIMTSPDGTTWTSRTPAESIVGLGAVTWSAENATFVAVGSTGGVARLAMSPDGVTWSDVAVPGAGDWLAVASGNGVVVAVGDTSGTIQVMGSAQYAHLTGVPASGPGSILYPILQGDPVNLLVQVDDAAAQTALATLLGGGDDGVIEDSIVDGRLGHTEALARGNAQLALCSKVLASITFKTRDKNTRAGRTIHVALGSPTNLTADFLIQHVTIDTFIPLQMPTFTAQASSRLFSLEDLIRIFKKVA